MQKKSKGKEKDKVTVEKQIENLENNANKLEKINKELKAKAAKEKKRKLLIKEKAKTIREDLNNQLVTQSKFRQAI